MLPLLVGFGVDAHMIKALEILFNDSLDTIDGAYNSISNLINFDDKFTKDQFQNYIKDNRIKLHIGLLMYMQSDINSFKQLFRRLYNVDGRYIGSDCIQLAVCKLTEEGRL